MQGSVRRLLTVCLACCAAGLLGSPVIALGESSPSAEGSGVSSLLEDPLVVPGGLEEGQQVLAAEEVKGSGSEEANGSSRGAVSSSEESLAKVGEGSSSGGGSGLPESFGGPLVVPGVQSLDGAQQSQAARQAQLANPEAVAERERSRTEFEGLGGSASVSLAERVFGIERPQW